VVHVDATACSTVPGLSELPQHTDLAPAQNHPELDIEGYQLTCVGYRVFLPPLPAKWGQLGVWKPRTMWPDIFTK